MIVSQACPLHKCSMFPVLPGLYHKTFWGFSLRCNILIYVFLYGGIMLLQSFSALSAVQLCPTWDGRPQKYTNLKIRVIYWLERSIFLPAFSITFLIIPNTNCFWPSNLSIKLTFSEENSFSQWLLMTPRFLFWIKMHNFNPLYTIRVIFGNEEYLSLNNIKFILTFLKVFVVILNSEYPE